MGDSMATNAQGPVGCGSHYQENEVRVFSTMVPRMKKQLYDDRLAESYGEWFGSVQICLYFFGA